MDIEHRICFLLLCNKLPQHTFILTIVVGQISGLSLATCWVQALTRLQPRSQPSWFSCRSSTGEELTSVLTQAFGKIYFLMIIGLEAPASCWQSARGCPQQLEASLSTQQLPQLLQAAQSSLPCGLPQNGHLISLVKSVSIMRVSSIM